MVITDAKPDISGTYVCYLYTPQGEVQQILVINVPCKLILIIDFQILIFILIENFLLKLKDKHQQFTVQIQEFQLYQLVNHLAWNVLVLVIQYQVFVSKHQIKD